MSLFISVLDLLGTGVFAASGAVVALRRSLDLFGVLVLSFITAAGGGILRDLLLGITPPAAFRDISYVLVAGGVGLFTFFFSRFVLKIKNVLEIFDAIGLGLFTVTGVSIGLGHHIAPFAAVLLGVLTGVGGGALRDILAARVPSVLREEIYASACLAGALFMLALEQAPGVSRQTAGFIAAPLVTLIRLLAYWRGWRLPVGRIKHED